MEPDEAIPTSDYANPPEGNPIQGGAQAAEGFLARTFGPQGPIPNTGAEAIPTGDDDSIGTPASAGGAGQGDPGDQPQENPGEVGKGGFGKMGRGIKAIASYLMGAGAVPPQVLQQAADQIDPKAGMSASDRNLMVIEDANQRGGKEAAWKMMQANRVAYNAKQAFAYTALNGTQQKPPDIHAAVDAANQAADHVLDGSNAHFMVSTGGQITATVKGPDGGPAQVFDLTPDQFRKYLNVGGAGQWDRQMQGGVAATLASLSADNQEQQRTAAVSQRAASMAPKEDAQRQPQDPTTRQGGSNSFNMRSAGEDEYDPSLVRKAWGMFPGAGSQKERAEWLAAQSAQEDKLQNAVDVAKEKGVNTTRTAQIRADALGNQQKLKNEGGLAIQGEKTKSFQYASDAKVRAKQIEADQKAAHDGNVDARARIETARKSIATKRMTAGELSPEDKALEQQLTQQASQPRQQQSSAAPQQQSSAAPQQQAAAPGAPPVPGARFYKGQWYTRGANGEAVPYQQ